MTKEPIKTKMNTKNDKSPHEDQKQTHRKEKEKCETNEMMIGTKSSLGKNVGIKEIHADMKLMYLE
jgi:hypothetical protein